METEEQVDQFAEFMNNSKPVMSVQQNKNLCEMLYTAGELGFFEEESISEASALMIITFFNNCDGELEDFKTM